MDLVASSNTKQKRGIRLDESELAQIRPVANLIVLKRHLRFHATLNLFFAVLAVCMTFVPSFLYASRIGLLLAGILLFASGIELWFAQKPSGLIIQGIVLVSVGCWLLVASWFDQWLLVFSSVGWCSLFFGVPHFWMYRWYRHGTAKEETAEARKSLSLLREGLLAFNALQIPGVVEFVSPTRHKAKIWRIWLGDRHAVVAGWKEILIADRSEIMLRPTRLLGLPNAILKFRGHKWKISIPREDWSRIHQWSAGHKHDEIAGIGPPAMPPAASTS